MNGDEVRVVRSEDFHRLFLATRDADRVLYRQLRAALRDAGKPIVSDVKRAIAAIPSSGRYHSGVRAALIAGTRVSISASQRSAGIKIVTSPSRLPAGKKPLAKAMNKPAFRHPVFGGGWAVQSGNPYFDQVISRHVADVHREVARAMEHTAEQIARKVG